MHLFRAAPLLIVLSACAPALSSGDGTTNDECGASALQDLVGQDAAVLQTMRFAQVTRIIRPDTAVTMDFSPDRLNILINADEMIASVTCG